jgi:hypothetical protein
MRCAVALCAVESEEPQKEDMTCGGKGATNGPEGLWCVAAWQAMWVDKYPTYAEFITARPWRQH